MSQSEEKCWRENLSPLRLVLLAINAVCFGAGVVLLAVGAGGGPVVLLTVGTGLSMAAGIAGAVMVSRRMRPRVDGKDDAGTKP